MDTISHVTDKIKTAFDKQGIEIPYPRRDITITHRQGVSESDARQPVSNDNTS
jgi:small-conductance mechanosensitive channel